MFIRSYTIIMHETKWLVDESEYTRMHASNNYGRQNNHIKKWHLVAKDFIIVSLCLTIEIGPICSLYYNDTTVLDTRYIPTELGLLLGPWA